MASNTQHHELALPRLDGPVRLLAVVAPYYKDITDGLLQGVRATADAAGASLEVIEVPGALEIPTAVGLAHRSGQYDGFVALGCVIRGETTHYDTVCNDSSRALTLLGLQGVCLGNGILTVETLAQAQVRADPAGQNKGGGAAAAALHLVALARRWPRTEQTQGQGA
ncbi:6,7-dimethyl-8-ribityllumazine synthase [Paracoccus hibiscisoli]|uniref:6,7-dimethyl-8-ribityllumazine synthase n=1 Tax=Paracoccus hibiscisoli TaxID=2023261 RepID=A0A4U0QJD1_9RHOB|nr:6,7-dimethyl-8-ribityllumazine synthase [Paracoccus hibiscisoli]TJZ81815.1 6,7-dimethyl-8-ribityllumazine synthase [Paracoccus hibiscisoli]